MSRTLEWFARHGVYMLPAGIFAGLVMPDLAGVMRPLLAPSILVMLAVILTRVDLEVAQSQIRHPKLVLLALAWTIVALPVLAMLAITFIPMSKGLQLALIFHASSPPNFAVAAVAYMLGLNGALCLAIILAAMLCHPVLTPFFTTMATEGAVSVSGIELALRLAAFIGGAAVLAAIARWQLGPERLARAGPALDGTNVIIMLVFAIALMDGIPAQIAERPLFALGVIALSFALHLGSNLATLAVFWRTGRQNAASLGYAAGGRNIGIVMSVVGTAAPADTWLFFALVQFPIYVLPLLLRPFYRRLFADV